MRAFVMDGGPAAAADRRGTARAGLALRSDLDGRGYDVDAVLLCDTSIAYCRGCFECWTRTPGVCRTADPGRDLARRLIASDVAVFLTPVTFGGYSSELKKAVDRIIGLVSPFFCRVDGETHHVKRYRRYPAIVGLGVLPAPDPDDEEIFRTLVRRNALNLRAPASAAAIVYPDDDDARLGRAVAAAIDALDAPEVRS